VRLRPADPEGHATLAEALYRAGDNQAALAEIQAAIRIKSDQAAYFIQSGLIRYGLGDLFNAVRDVDTAMALDPGRANYFAMRAYLYYQRSEYSRALADVDESLRLQPDYPAALYVRGLSKYQQAEYDRSLADLDAVLKHEPFEYDWPFLRIENLHEINLDRALVLQEMPGRAAEARAAFDNSAAANPDWFAIYYYRGVYVAGQGEFQGARADLQRALTFAPDENWRDLARTQLEALK
jgi:tetratricopeptide (TPR) repeat protein